MGKTDKYILPVYRQIADKYTQQDSVVGMFGFTDTDKMSKFWRKMDFYDLRLSNWDINGDWDWGKIYKTIVCLRTTGFATNVIHMLKKFHSRLLPGGTLFIDWSLGSDHYVRDSKKKSWGWLLGDQRCFGAYDGKRCPLYSSCLTNDAVRSEAFAMLRKEASRWKHYREVTDWKEQIRSEFEEQEIVSAADIEQYFDIIHEQSWTPLDKNGRFQLYTIQVLRKC